MQATTTIAAVSTPQGAGGIGVVRISGPEALAVGDRAFRARSGKPLAEMRGYRACLGSVVRDGVVLDEAVVTVYRAPKSYTGEDVVELSCHGGAWLVSQVLRLCLDCGAEPAQPGEFTRRAFLNGKLDLLQAEAVMDLISAQGEASRRAALSARDGALSRRVRGAADRLVEQSAHLAAWTDYPEEDIQAVELAALASALEGCQRELEALLATYDRGHVLREGLRTAIVGRPNVGKSTLMNLLSGREKSIVTDIPGTTRDVVDDLVRVGGVVLHLFDTAGIRETDDAIEQIGVAKARQALDSARLVLVVLDSSRPLEPEDLALLDRVGEKPLVCVINKSDLPPALDESALPGGWEPVRISAATGQGREALEQAILRAAGLENLDAAAPMIGNERQRAALARAAVSVRSGREALDAGLTLDAVNVDIDDALDALLGLTGERVTDRVVDEVFSKFCVGK